MGLSEGLTIVSYYWFGNAPGAPMPSIEAFKISTRVTPDASGKRPARPNYREVPFSKFDRLASLDDVLRTLLGTL